MVDTTIQQDLPKPRIATSPRRIRWSAVITYSALAAGLLIVLMPFLWMISWSLMSLSDVVQGKFIPGELHFDNYEQAWEGANFDQYMWNSIRITVIIVIGRLAFCIPAAYAFARMRFYGRSVLFSIVLSTLMIPDIVTLIPNFLTVTWISRLSQDMFGQSATWLNNWPALTVPFMASAFTIFLLRQFFAQIPNDLWDAARIDGAGHLTFLLRIVMPLSRAPIMTVTTFAFIGAWNMLLWPLLVVQTDDWRPVAHGLTKFTLIDNAGYFHLQMAGSVIMMMPVLALYFVAQKQFTESIATSGIAG